MQVYAFYYTVLVFVYYDYVEWFVFMCGNWKFMSEIPKMSDDLAVSAEAFIGSKRKRKKQWNDLKETILR